MRHFPRIFAFASLALACLLSAPGVLAQQGGTLTGRVVSATGQPVTDAEVKLVDLRRRTTTGDDAGFRFEGLPAGSYLVEVLSPRYGTGLARVEVAAGASAEVTITLELASQVDEIVVSAGEPRRQLELAQAVNVLGGEELALRLQPSLGETLANEPGVSSTFFGPGASRPIIRGLGGDRVSMLQGGIGTGDVSTTSPDHAVSADPAFAERIEVLRGPATLLYGSSAIGGVVNTIDRSIPDYEPNAPISGFAELRGGSAAEERTGLVSLGGGRGSWAWHLEGLRRKTGDVDIPGFASLDPEAQAEQERGTLANSSLENTSASLGVSRFFDGKGFFGIAVSGLDSNYGIPGPEEEGVPIRIDLERRRVDFRGEITQGLGPFEGLKARAGWVDYEHVELEGEEVGTRFTNDYWEGRLELVQKPWRSLTGSLGLQVRDRRLEAVGEEAFIPPVDSRSWALFAFEEIPKGPLTFQFGLRFESQDNSAEPIEVPDRSHEGLSASFGTLWKLTDDTSLAISLARSTKLPNAEELYSNGLHAATQAVEIGDPNLDLETSLGLDVSLRKHEGPFTAELTAFVNRFDDFIYDAFTGEEEEGFPVLAFTQADAEFRGLEFQGRAELWRSGNRHFDLQLSGDYVRAELRATGEALSRIPPLRYGLGVHYHTEKLHAFAELRRVETQDRVAENETPTDGYTLLGASVAYRFFSGGQIVDLLLRGTNLTDEEARNHVSFLKDDVPLPGRDLSLSLRLTF